MTPPAAAGRGRSPPLRVCRDLPGRRPRRRVSVCLSVCLFVCLWLARSVVVCLSVCLSVGRRRGENIILASFSIVREMPSFLPLRRCNGEGLEGELGAAPGTMKDAAHPTNVERSFISSLDVNFGTC